MRIRVKLTIILLVAALAPLLLVKFVDAEAIGRLSGRVAEQVTGAVTRRVEQELSLHTERIAARMGEQARTVRLMVRSQAELFQEAGAFEPSADDERAVAGEPGAPAVRTPREFTESPETVPGLREQPGWRAGAGQVPLVSYDTPVFVAAPELSLNDPAAAGRARLVLETVDLLEAMSSNDRALVRSQYVCFTDGLHVAYPGKGGYPAGFDGRSRPWYAAAAEADQAVWTGPVLDAVTGEARMTCSMAVRTDAGDLLGVTAVDVSLRSVLDSLTLPPELAFGSEALLVTIPGDTVDDGRERPEISETGGGVRVLMAVRDGTPGVRVLADPEPLAGSDGAGLARIADDLASGRSGVVQMPRGEAGERQDSFWAYARMGPGIGIVMIVPTARVSGIVEGVRQDLRALSRETTRSTAAASLVVVALAFLVAYLLGRTLSRPIRRLADAAEAVAGGDLDARAEVAARRDEIGKLTSAFNQMVPALADRMRMRESLALANDLQQGLLPSEHPAIPGFDVFGVSVYCDETGGDYFDYLQPLTLGEHRYGVVVGDVTGHGIPAALIMTSARALLQSHARAHAEPGAVLDRVNETIASDASQGRFITLLLLVFDTARRTLSAANAGHDPGVVYRASSGVFDEMPTGGLPLGIDPDERYATSGLEYPTAGDVYLIATDGVWETRDRGGAFYGKERMRGVIRAHAGEPAEAIGRALLASLDEFRGSAPKLDDVTFIVVKATG